MACVMLLFGFGTSPLNQVIVTFLAATLLKMYVMCIKGDGTKLPLAEMY